MIAQLSLPSQYLGRPDKEAGECEAIISKISGGFSELLQLYHATPVKTLQAPGRAEEWSIKDTFAVVSAWIWRCAALLDAAHLSNGPLLADPDVDGLNQEFYNNRQDWNCIDVEVDFCKAHQTLLTVLKQFPPERLTDQIVRDTIATQIYQRHTDCYARLRMAIGFIPHGK